MASTSFLFSCLKKVIEIRCTEEIIANDYKKNNIKAFLHLAAGQEATAVGISKALNNKDFFIGNHRSHGHYLAKNGNWKKMILESYGQKSGCCNGYGGSMHMLDRSVGFVGSTPILGSALPIAAGIAASKKFNNKKKEIVVVFGGDGAAEEGAFYETVNLAGKLNLPLLIVLEDNLYSVETDHFTRKTSGYNFKKIFREGFSVDYNLVNGQDVIKVYELAKKMKKNILQYNKIGLMHAKVLRKYAHSGPNIDQDKSYRKADKPYMHEKNDPINIIKNYLIKKNISLKVIDNFIKLETNKIDRNFQKIRSKIKVM